MSKHTTGAWLGMLGKLVSAAGNRDASAWEQGEQVATAHTELFNELRRMDDVQAELLEALEYMLETNESGDNAGDQARAQARAAIARAKGGKP